MSAGPSRLGKVYAVAMVVVCLGVGYAIFDWTRWWVLDTRVQARVVSPIAKPTTAEVLQLKPRIFAEARALWITEAEMNLEMHCEQHLSNGFALAQDQSTIYWFLVVKASCHGRKATWEMRLDNKLPETDGEALESAGVKVVKRA
jgi:hypothetical protein